MQSKSLTFAFDSRVNSGTLFFRNISSASIHGLKTRSAATFSSEFRMLYMTAWPV